MGICIQEDHSQFLSGYLYLEQDPATAPDTDSQFLSGYLLHGMPVQPTIAFLSQFLSGYLLDYFDNPVTLDSNPLNSLADT